MRTIAFDGRTGASGDMLLGSLIATGADPAVLEPIEQAIDVTFDIDHRTVQGIQAVDVSVTQDGQTVEGHGPHRSYEAVVDTVASMGLADEIEAQTTAVFHLLAAAEAAVHGSTIEEIHFHEVGADDAIADVTGTVSLLNELNVDRVVTGPVSAGSGEVTTSHGTYPVPPPAVVEIASRSELSIRQGPVEGELLTPSGAAILGALAEPVDQLPPMEIDSVGYGAGDRSIPERPNVLRAMVGQTQGELTKEGISVLETHVDDASPELLGHLQDRLRSVGARDIAIVPLTMKKSRPGHLIKIVVRPEDEHRVARVLAAETGTLGVRARAATHRWVADRLIETVTIPIDGREYDIDVKIATDETGERLDVSAEFDDAATIAGETDRPVREIMRRAESVVHSEAEP